jgi:hypothetical protein
LAISVDEAMLESAEVTSAGRSYDKIIRAEHDLKKVRTVVMEITEEGAVEKVCAGLCRVNRERISARTICNSPMDAMTSPQHKR